MKKLLIGVFTALTLSIGALANSAATYTFSDNAAGGIQGSTATYVYKVSESD